MAFGFFKKKWPRACIIGLDGVPYTIITSLCESVMPRTREILSTGCIAPMTVTVPEISSVSWSTFMTGKNPGEHSIFGFTDLKEGGYDLRFPSFRDLKAKTIWEVAGKKGLRSVVINQPSTYPARSIPGVLISGFVAIELEKSVAPLSYYPELEKKNYRVDIDTAKCATDPELLFRSLHELLDLRRNVMDDLWERESWSIMEIVVTGTDRLHHFMWDAYEDTSSPFHERFLEYYAAVDRFIGYAHEKAAATAGCDHFFILSDHGFCKTQREVYVNSVLRSAGFLDIGVGESSLEKISEKTSAFALDPARIYIHKRGRFARGTVNERDVRSIVSDLRSLFEELEIGGRKVVRRIFERDEVYRGPYTQLGPDLLLVPENGFDLKGKVGAEENYGDRRLQGMHTWDNAFFFSNDPSLVDKSELGIEEIPEKILRSIGVERKE